MATPSIFATGINLVTTMRGTDGFIQTEPFLEMCRQVLPIVDKLGNAFALVRTDVGGNIQRLATKAATDPERYSRLFTIVQDDIVSKTHTTSTSCTKGLLWLKRAMEFIMAILARIYQEGDGSEGAGTSLSTIVSETYTATLYQYHGFFASSAFTLAFKFVPSKSTFLQNLGEGPELFSDMKKFMDGFGPILQEIHQYLDENGLNDPTKV